MGVNISGQGVLSGLATLVAGIVQSFNLLVTKIIGYTNIPGTGGSSYYTTMVGSIGPGFVAIVNESNKAAYSTDGITWTASNLPSTSSWISVTHADGKFVAVAYNSNKAAYSTDGITWIESTMPSSEDWQSVTHGDDKFVAIARFNDKAAYSTDGINWTESTLPSGNWPSVTHGNGKFVAVANNSNKAAYSTDGITWIESTLPSSEYWESVTHGDDKFVAIARFNDKAAYSTDGITWIESTLPSIASWYSVTQGQISTLVEVQVSIGNQGEEAAEILAPVDVYTVPAGKTTNIDEVTIKNNSANTITYDLGILNPGVELTDLNANRIDQPILPGQTVTVTTPAFENLSAGQRIVVFPSAVDVVEVKVYGTEFAGSTIFSISNTMSMELPSMYYWTLFVEDSFDITRQSFVYNGVQYEILFKESYPDIDAAVLTVNKTENNENATNPFVVGTYIF